MRPTSRRKFLLSAAAGTSALALPMRRVLGANDAINLGFIGVGERGAFSAKWFSEIPGVRVAAVCDADEQRMDACQAQFPQARKIRDLRKLIDDKGIDAVVISTCNHWHALAAIWACQAGKDVYVEKPVSQTVWEGRKIVEAARKYGRIVQGGTQQRSDPCSRNPGADPVRETGKDALDPREPLRPARGHRQAVRAAQAARVRRLRPVARPRPGPAHLPQAVPLRLALGLEHRLRRARQLGRSRPRRHPQHALRQVHAAEARPGRRRAPGLERRGGNAERPLRLLRHGDRPRDLRAVEPPVEDRGEGRTPLSGASAAASSSSSRTGTTPADEAAAGATAKTASASSSSTGTAARPTRGTSSRRCASATPGSSMPPSRRRTTRARGPTWRTSHTASAPGTSGDGRWRSPGTSGPGPRRWTASAPTWRPTGSTRRCPSSS